MNVRTTPLAGLVIIEPRVFNDERGFFLETFQDARYRQAGIPDGFVQDNHSRSGRRVLRGMHFQVKHPQAKLITVIRGRVFDVGVDLRRGSATFGQAFGAELGEGGPQQMFIPAGCAHGFCVLSDWADLHYKVSQPYDPPDEAGIRWDDPDLNIPWPIASPLVSPRDAAYPVLKDLAPNLLPLAD